MKLPDKVAHHLRTATRKTTANRSFQCSAFSPQWNSFVEHWAPIVHSFVEQALGPYGTEPGSEIVALPDAAHAAWATASFNPMNGQVCLSPVVEGNPGQTLEKLTHEFTHGSLAQFPEGDPFYEEGQVDYSVWVLAHAPVWGEHREAMIHAAEYNIAQRRDRAFRTGVDYDRKRWAGGLHAMYAYGPFIITRLATKKREGDFSW